MIINATLLVQAAHFWCVYLILHFLILKPLFAVLKEEEQHEETITQQIERVTQAVDLKAAQNTQEWVQMQKALRVETPTVEPSMPSPEFPTYQKPALDASYITSSIKRLRTALVKRVSYDQCD